MTNADQQNDVARPTKAPEALPWKVIWLLMFGMIIAYFDRVNLSVAKEPMAEAFGWTATEQGIALGAIFISYTLLQIPSGILVDRFGVRLPYLIGFLIWSFASAATFFTASLTMLIMIRLLVGVGESVVTPSSMRYIRLHFDEERRGRAVGLYMMGTKLGPFLGFMISGWLMEKVGWEWMFVAIGVTGLVWLVPWLAWVKKDDPAASSHETSLKPMAAYFAGTCLAAIVSVQPVMWIARTMGWSWVGLILVAAGLLIFLVWYALRARSRGSATTTPVSERAGARTEGAVAASHLATVSVREIVSSPVMWGVILGTFCYMYFVYYSMTWMPSFFVQRFDMSIKDASWYPAVSFGGMAVMIWVGGWLADWFIARGHDPINVRKYFIVLGFALASTQTVGAFTDDLALVKFFAIFSLCGLGLATANYWALTQTLIPGGSIAMVVGIQNTAANLAGIVAPIVTGFLIDQTGSFDAPIKFVGLFLAIGILGYIFLVRRKYAPRISEA